MHLKELYAFRGCFGGAGLGVGRNWAMMGFWSISCGSSFCLFISTRMIPVLLELKLR